MKESTRFDFSHTRHLLERYVQLGSIAGASLQVTQHGETILATQVGYADRERQKIMTSDTIFRIFSMTKPLTVVCFLLLCEQGLVHVNDPVSAYLPGFRDTKVWVPQGQQWTAEPAERELTLHHLLTMTSGIPYPHDPSPASQSITALLKKAAAAAAAGQVIDLPALANHVGAIPLNFQPGSHWLYGLSLDIIGAVIEVVSGKKLSCFMQEQLLDPLGMKETGFQIKPESMERLAGLYAEKEGVLIGDAPNDLTPGDPCQPPMIEYGGAGLFSTRSDYTRFARMLLGGGTLEGCRILSSKSVDLMRSNHLGQVQIADYNWDTLKGYGYGLGVRCLLDPIPAGTMVKPGEFGWDGAAGTWFSVDPNEDMTIVYMVQRFPANHIRFIPRLQATIYAAL
ncbi:MAG: serine hydrolase domain-containing protein [Clostridiaceae bacterium]|nr:serine hydrolase domain-containing protein [Clostridiaceae bacterium]